MKLILVFVFFLSSLQFSYSQCSQNTEPASTVEVFDWRTETFDFYLTGDFEQAFYTEVTSPFYIAENSSQFNTDHFARAISKDFQPEDGWELIFYNFGTPSVGVFEPSFALYNRYNGLFRFFMYMKENESGIYHETFISTFMVQLGDDFNNSALMESVNPIQHSLEDFDKKIALSYVNRLSDNERTWVVSEWLTHYDPCTCYNSLKMLFVPKLQNLSILNLNLEGQGSTVPIYSSANNDNSGDVRAAIGEIGTTVENINGDYKQGNVIYKNYHQLDSILEEKVGHKIDPELSVESGPDILKEMARIISKSGSEDIESNASLISFANTLIGSSTTKNIASQTSGFELNSSGEEIVKGPLPATTVYVPGSNHDGYPEARKPIYDNVLGVATIVNSLEVEYLKESVYTFTDECSPMADFDGFEYYEYFRLIGDPKYAVNTNVGIKKNPKNIKAAIVFDISVSFDGGNLSEEELINEEFGDAEELIRMSYNKYRTPYMNLSCLKEYPITLKTGVEIPCAINNEITVTPYLSLAMVLENDKGNEIAYLSSYKITKEAASYKWEERKVNEFLNIPESISVAYSDISGNLETWGETTVLNAPDKTITIINDDGSTSIISLDSDNDPSKPTEYSTQEFAIDCGEVLPVSNVYLNSFCQSIKYDPVVAFKLSENNTIEEEAKLEIKIYPNPASNFIYFNSPKLDGLDFDIYTVYGESVLTGTVTENKINIKKLIAGTYFIKLTNNKNIIANDKFIKI